MEGEDKGEGIEGISDVGHRRSQLRCGVSELLSGEVIFTELIAELELR